jgi:hypothetical protein
MKTIRPILIALLLAPSLSGCLALGAAAVVTDVAVGTAGTVIKTAGNVGGAAIDIVTPGDDEDDDNR